MEELRAQGKHPYYIYGDKTGRGNEGTAASAYAEAYAEIREFEKKQGWEFDYVFCPSGTGATQSGLICGHLLAGDRKKIIGILISSRETKRAVSVISDGLAVISKRMDMLCRRTTKKRLFCGMSTGLEDTESTMTGYGNVSGHSMY